MTWNSDLIMPGSEYGNARTQAAAARVQDRYVARESQQTVHGLTPIQMNQLHGRMNEMMPRLASTDASQQVRSLFDDTLPKGATWDARRTGQAYGMGGMGMPNAPGGSGGGGGSMYNVQRPYQPEFESPDRQQYPVHRILANRYWRLFIKLDPIIGTGLDMYSEMCWSDCKLTGEGVEGEVREVYESMWEACNVLTLLPAMTREFIGIGEVIPHCFFDDAEGMWTYIALHNPDNLEVIDAPFIKMEPIVEFVPDDRLRAILTSSDPELQGIREKMPPELIAKLYSRQNIRINTDVNATFLARKLHPYETRGTSILSRMWRILMYEDAIFNASIATARRHAGPIKIAKLGNPQTNWIPGPEQERRFAELVAQAEMDPHAWIIYHYGVQLEAFGTTDRVMTINREWEVIERIKLAAMGISRSFLTGELTFASATAGLQVFLRRLLSLRNHFETLWLRPKFFKPIAEINQFYRRDKAELDHGIRIKRTAQEIREQKRLIVPKIEWANKLNPMVDKDLISAYEQLERMGIRISKTKKHASVNLQYEEELRRSLEEDKFENAVRKEYGDADEAGNADELAKIITHTDESLTTDEKEKEEGGQGAGDGKPKPKGPPPNPMKGASRTAAENDPDANGAPWDEQGNAYGWRKEEVDGLIELLTTGETESAFWSLLEPTAPEGEPKDLITRSGDEPKQAQGDTPYSALQAGDPDTCWVMIDDFLQDQGYPEADIQGLQRVLMAEKVLPSTRTAALDAFFTSLPDDSSGMSDKEFGNRFAKSLEKRRPFADRSSARHLARPDNFLVGEESAREAGRRRSGTLFSDGFAKAEHAENCACCKTAIKTPDFDPPANHAAREEWQRGLQHSKIPQDAKNYIRQIENEFTDGWMASFDILWKDLESRIDKGQRLEPGMIGAIISDQVRKQMNLVDLEHVTNAFTGLYSEGKDFAYKPTGFREKKLETLRKRSSRVAFVREAITIDTHEDKLMLEHIKQTALKKVKTITDKDMLQSILQGLSEPGASNKNPLQLADEIVRSEADKRRLQTDYYDAEARTTLKNQLSDLYENQLWKVQRIMRTEAVNGFVVAQLQGYKEQGIVKVMWNSHHDSRVCAKCRALDGTTFEVDTLMSNNNRYPISTESHPNCRCVSADTQVKTRSGWKQIAAIEVGEEVLTATTGWQRVTAKFTQEKAQSDRRDVQMYSLNGVRITGDHQVKVIDEHGTELWKRVDALDSSKDTLVKVQRRLTKSGCTARSLSTKKSLLKMKTENPSRYAENSRRRGDGIKRSYTPELRATRAKAASAQFENPAHVALHSAKAKKQWQEGTLFNADANSASMKRRWAEHRDVMLEHMSKVELKKFNEFERRVQNALDRYHVPWVAQQIVAGQLCDLVLPGNVVIEVDGVHWHGGCKLCGKTFVRLQDIRKEETLKDAGFKLYRICECQLDSLDAVLAKLLEAAYAQG